MRGKETLWKQIRTLWTVLLLAVLFVGAVQVKAEETSEEVTTQEETQAPTITITPYIDEKEYTGEYLPLDIGSKHILSVQVAVSDGSTPIYEWWRNNEDKPIEKEESNTVTIKKGIGAESYYVNVTTENGGFASCSFWLNPEETLQVTQWIGDEQTNYAACQIGDFVTFEIKAESTYDPDHITYQWRDSNGSCIEGADESKYTIQKRTVGSETYSCEISDGNYTISYPFSVDLGATLSYTLQINGQDYEEWDNYACTEDKEYTLSVNANTTIPDGNIEYQWHEWSDNGTDVVMDGKQDATLTVNKPTGYKQYYCEINDGNNWRSAHFNLNLGDTLTVKALTINDKSYMEYDSFTCEEEGPYTLKVDAISTLGDVHYQWYESPEEGYGYVEMPGETNSQITVSKPTGRKEYYCHVSDGNDSDNKYFYLDLGDTLSVKRYVDGNPYYEYTTLECKENETVKLEVKAESSLGEENITYDWYYYDQENNYSDIEEDSAICNFSMKAGYYQVNCTVNDGNENQTYSFQLTTPPTLSVRQYMNGEGGTNFGQFVNGEPVKLEVKASTTSGNDITYQWYKGSWCDESTKLSGQQSSVLNITKDEESENGYCCKVSDGIFTEECNFYINSENTVYIRGFINDGSYSDDLTFEQGDEIILRVEATSNYDNDHMTYQWYQEIDGDMIELKTEEPTVCKVKKGSGTEYYECVVDDGNSQSTYTFELYEDIEHALITCIPYIDGERYNGNCAEKYNCAIGQSLTLRAEVLTEEADDISRVWEYYDEDQDNWVEQEETGESISVNVSSQYNEYRCTIIVGEEEATLHYELYARNTGGGDDPDDDKYTYMVPYINGKEGSDIGGHVGDVVNLSVEVVNPPENVIYQWYKDRGVSEDVAIKGETKNTYSYTIEKGVQSLSCVIYADGNRISTMNFYVADAFEEEEENTLTVTRYYINDVETNYVEYTPGQDITLGVEAESTTGNEISYTWYDEDGIQLGTGKTYLFKPSGYQEIHCQVFDGVSYENAWFELDMISTWSATQYIDGVEAEEKVCAENASVQLEMRVTGEPAGELTYKWFNNRNKLIGEEAILPITASAKSEMYRCRVSDGYQTREYEFYLKPAGNISFDVIQYIDTEQTDEVYLEPGATAELKVDVSGTTEGITYQWYIFKGEGAYSPLGTAATQKITAGEYEDDYYLCVIRIGSVEKTAYFNVYSEGQEPTDPEEPTTPTITPEEPTKPSDQTTQTQPSTQPSQPSSPAQKPQTQTPSAPASSPAPAVGTTLVSSDKKAVYKVTGSNTVEYTKAASNKAKVTIPSTVTYQGRKYQVTSIGAKAFRNSKKLKKVVIPSTVRKIGKQAFANCKKLKSITIKTNKLSAKTIGNKAFKGINAKATIKVPKKKLKLYKKILRAKGVSASAKIK